MNGDHRQALLDIFRDYGLCKEHGDHDQAAALWNKFEQALTEAQAAAHGCTVNPLSSRSCEFGTRSCTTEHDQPEPVGYRYRHSEGERWQYGPVPQNWWECRPMYDAAPQRCALPDISAMPPVTETQALWDIYAFGKWQQRVTAPIEWDAHTVYLSLVNARWSTKIDVRAVSANNCCEAAPGLADWLRATAMRYENSPVAHDSVIQAEITTLRDWATSLDQMRTEVGGDNWAVAECWSSAEPKRPVRVLADGPQDIEQVQAHDSFIRWLGRGPRHDSLNMIPRVKDLLTNRKANDIAKRDGYTFTGYVLTHPERGQCIVNMSAVRWIKNPEFWTLMHPENSTVKSSDAPLGYVWENELAELAAGQRIRIPLWGKPEDEPGEIALYRATVPDPEIVKKAEWFDWIEAHSNLDIVDYLLPMVHALKIEPEAQPNTTYPNLGAAIQAEIDSDKEQK